MTTKLPFWATIFTIAGVIVLCGLGTWQIQRLTWKNEIIAGLNAAYDNPQSQAIDISAFKPGSFVYGRVSGVFLPDKAILLGPKTKDGKIGNDLIVPVKQNGTAIFVNMGWTASKLEDLPIHHLQNKKLWFEGLARTPRWNSFTPENNPEKNLWYKPDLTEIAAVKNLQHPAPFILHAERASHKFDAAFPNNERWMPANNHLQYAAFWFTMALALCAVYVLRFIRKV